MQKVTAPRRLAKFRPVRKEIAANPRCLQEI